MSEPSNIFLTNKTLNVDSGQAINLDDFGLISTSSISSPSGPTTPATNIQNFNQKSPNLILNGNFDTGDFTNWTTVGSCTVNAGTYPGISYSATINNISSISQTVTGFQNYNPILTFAHFGPECIVSLDLLDASDVLVGNQNRIFPDSGGLWLTCTIGYYSGISTATKARITLYSDNDGCQVTNINLIASYGFAGITVGDLYNDYRDTISFSARKFFFGSADELISTRPERFDIRSDLFVKGNLNVNGIISSEIIYGPPGSQPFSSNIIFSAGSSDTVNTTSGIIQTLDTTSYGISSFSTGVMTVLSYIYLDLDISSSVLQITTTNSTAIGNRKILLATATPSTSGGLAVFNVFSGQSVISTQLSDVSSNMGNLTVTGLLTIKDAPAAITLGLTGSLPTSSTVGTGLWIDRSGVYSLLSDVQQATLSSTGLSAGGGTSLADASGFSIILSDVFDSLRSYKFKTLLGVTKGYFTIFDTGGSNTISRLYVDLSSTGANIGGQAIVDIGAHSLTGNNAIADIQAVSEGSAQSSIILRSNTTQSFIQINSSIADVDTRISGDTETNLIYVDASVDCIAIGTDTPNTSAILDITSTTKAFMPPRMTTTQRNAISSPTAGMIIYNSTTNKLNVYTTLWEQVTSA